MIDWRVSACEGPQSHESQHVWPLLDQFQPGDLVIADRAYASYFLLAALAQRGIDFVIRQHQCRRHDGTNAHRVGSQDYVVSWRKPTRPRWMAVETYAELPAELNVREVRDGRLVATTSLTQPRRTPAAEVISLYRKRWHVELDFRAIKSILGMDVLRCKSPAMIVKEIAVYWLGYNLIRAVMTRAASITTLGRQLSFAAARRAVIEFQTRRRHNPATCFDDCRRQLDQRVAFHTIPSRPGRVEPRAVKRRPKPQRLLKKPRAIARQEMKAA